MRLISLHKLLNLVDVKPSNSLINSKVSNISFDSKDSKNGTLFLGLPGTKVDGGIFWKDAIRNGAVAAIISEEADSIQSQLGRLPEAKMLLLSALMIADRLVEVESDSKVLEERSEDFLNLKNKN